MLLNYIKSKDANCRILIQKLQTTIEACISTILQLHSIYYVYLETSFLSKDSTYGYVL